MCMCGCVCAHVCILLLLLNYYVLQDAFFGIDSSINRIDIQKCVTFSLLYCTRNVCVMFSVWEHISSCLLLSTSVLVLCALTTQIENKSHKLTSNLIQSGVTERKRCLGWSFFHNCEWKCRQLQFVRGKLFAALATDKMCLTTQHKNMRKTSWGCNKKMRGGKSLSTQTFFTETETLAERLSQEISSYIAEKNYQNGSSTLDNVSFSAIGRH